MYTLQFFGLEFCMSFHLIIVTVKLVDSQNWLQVFFSKKSIKKSL